jgi:hypothetical protein
MRQLFHARVHTHIHEIYTCIPHSGTQESFNQGACMASGNTSFILVTGVSVCVCVYSYVCICIHAFWERELCSDDLSVCACVCVCTFICMCNTHMHVFMACEHAGDYVRE